MDEDDALAQMVAVGAHHLVEFVELIVEHVGVREATQVVEKLVNVKVYNNGLRLLFLAHRLGLWATGTIHLALVAHSVLKSTAVDAQLLCGQVVTCDIEREHWGVKIFGFMKAVKLVELGDI